MTTESQVTNAPAEALDAAVFEELRDTLRGQLDVVAGIYGKFLDNAVGYIGALRGQASDARALTLHTLKGSAAMVGANRIAALAVRLQEGSTAQAIDAAIPQLEDELATFRRVLAARFDSLGYRMKR